MGMYASLGCLHRVHSIISSQDLRDLTKPIVKVRHPTSVRTVVASPISWKPKHAFAGLDNGAIYRYMQRSIVFTLATSS